MLPSGGIWPALAWRSPFAASEDRNATYNEHGTGQGKRWRSPFAASEDRNFMIGISIRT